METQARPGSTRRRALATTGVTLASCAAFALVGTGAASAATKKPTKKPTKPKITQIDWGSADGAPVQLYTLQGAGGMQVKISTYGADIQSISVPDNKGKMTDVALGFSKLSDYVADFEQGANQTPFPTAGGAGDTYFGATVGRYANRIAKGTFMLDGKTYTLDINNGVNSLHGGYLGWNTHVWSATPATTRTQAKLTLSASFPAGEGCDQKLTPGCTGFPASVNAQVTFSVQKNNQLKISYAAKNTSTTDSTVVNLTNHTYFNLGGNKSGTVYGQKLALNADKYTPTDPTQIPEAPYFVPVKGTAFDFRSMHTIGKYISANRLPDGTSGPIRQLQYAHGYDHNWVLNGQGRYRLAAVAQDPDNGITMSTYTDQPGVQVYTGNYLTGDLAGKGAYGYRQGAGFTEETQHYPDSPNHQGQPGWPSVVLPAGQTFTTSTAYGFGVKPSNYKVSFK